MLFRPIPATATRGFAVAWLASAAIAFAAKPRPAPPSENPSEAETATLLGEAEPRLLKTQNPELRETVGLLHFRLKRWDIARVHLGRLAKPSERALDALARCHFELGDFRRAVAAFARAGDPSRSEETWRMANLSLQYSGLRSEAIKQWELFRQRYAAPAEALEFLARAYRRPSTGNPEKLLPVLEELLRLRTGSPEESSLLSETVALIPLEQARAAEYRARYLKLRPETPKVWRELAGCYAAQRNDAKAVETYLKAARYFPGDGAFLLKAADAVAKADPATASGLYVQALPLLPREARIPMELGRIRESFHLTEQAVEAYAEALRRAPALAEARERMAALCPSAKNPGACLAVMAEAEKGNPQDHGFQFRIAKALAARGDTAQAYRFLDKALRRAPDRREYRQLLPAVLARDGQITRHFAALETLRREGEPSPDLSALLCRGYSLLGNSPKAAEAARDLLRLDPVRAGAIRSAVFDAWTAKDAPLALRLSDLALAKNPDDAEVRGIQAAAAVAAEAPPQKQREAIQALMAVDPAGKGWLLRLAELELSAKDSAAAFSHAEAWAYSRVHDAKGMSLLLNLSRGRRQRADAARFALRRLAFLDTARRVNYALETADLHLAEGAPDQAVAILAGLAPALGKDAAYWRRFGLALQKLGRESSSAFERAWQLEPGNAEIALAFARTLADDSALAANIGALGAAIRGDSSAPLRAKYARACYLTGNIPAAAAQWDAVARQEPALAAEDTTAALAFLGAGQASKAAALLEQRAAKYPHETKVFSRLADLYEREGKSKEKVRALERLMLADPESPEAVRLAREKEKAGESGSALRLYAGWCRNHPQDAAAVKAYRDAAAAAGDSAAWQESLRLLTRLASTGLGTSPGTDKSPRFELAEIEYARGGDPAELERLTREYPDYRKGRLLLAREYGDRGDFRNLARFETFLEQESKAMPDLLEPLADLKGYQGEWDAANKAYFAWLGAVPGNPEAFSKVLRAAKEHSSPHLASILRIGVERNSEDLDLRVQYASALGKTPEALSVYEFLLQKRKDNLEWIVSAAELAHALGRRDPAQRWCEAWARLEPGEEKPLRILAGLHEQAGDRRAQSEVLEKLRALRDGDRDLTLRLARLREELGQWEAAFAAYRAAFYLSPFDKAVRAKVAALTRRQALKNAPELEAEMQALDTSAHETLFDAARAHSRRGDREKAYATLVAALEKSPHNPMYLALLPHAIHSREQLPRHFTHLQDLEMSPGLDRNDTVNARLFLHLARAYEAKEKWESAAGRYQEVFRLRPELLRGDRQALATAFKAKNWPLTAQLAEAWSEFRPGSDRETLRMQLITFEKLRRGDAAIRQTLRQFATFDRENAALRFRLAELELRAGDTASAHTRLRESLLLRPTAAAYAMLLPLLESRPGQASIVPVLENLALLDSTRRFECWTKLAAAAESRRDLRESHRLLTLLAAARPKDAAIWFRLGKARSALRLGDGGLAAFKRAFESAPNQVAYARALAQSLRTREEIRDQVAAFKFLAANDPSPAETRGLARALLYRGDVPGSAAAWDRLLKFPEERAQLQMEAAETYLRSGQPAKALPFYEMRLAREPDSRSLLDTLQSLYSQLRLEERRIRTLRQIVRVDPSHRDFQLQLARAKERTGEPAEALSHYGAWTARHPDAVEPLQSMRRLADSLRDTLALEKALGRLARLPRPQGSSDCDFAELEFHLHGDIEPLEGAVKSNSGCAYGKLLLARALHRRGEFSRLAPFEPELAATAASIDPALHELLADLYASQNKKDKANAAFTAWLRVRRDAVRKGGEVSRADFRVDLERAWKYAAAAASPTLPEILELGFEVFPGDGDLVHALGVALGPTPKASVFYRQWLKTHPIDLDAIRRASDIAVGQENWPEARSWSRRWAELRPADVAAWKRLVQVAEKLGDGAAQVAALERLADLQPEDPSAAFALGMALAKSDRPRACETLLRAVDLKPDEKIHAREALAMLESMADSALKMNQRARAMEWYALLFERFPDHRKAALYQGLAWAQGRNYAAAAPLLRAALQSPAEAPAVQGEIWRELAKAEAAINGPEAALPGLERALALNPDDAEAAREFLSIAQNPNLRGKFPEVLAAALRLDTGRADAMIELAALRLASGAFNEAARLLQKLAKIRPEDPVVFSRLGSALFALHRDGEAKAAFGRAYQFGDRGGETVGSLVKLHRKTGAGPEAVPVIEEWLRQNPEDVEIAAWAAEAAEGRRDWRNAGDWWALAWQADPGSIRHLEGLANSLIRRGQEDYAVELLEPHRDRLGPEGLILMGDAFAATGPSEKALESYRRAGKKKPSGRATAAEAGVWIRRKQPAPAERLLAVNPEKPDPNPDPETEKARARLFLLKRDVDSASAVVLSLANAHPREAEIQMLFGEVWMVRQDGGTAIKAFQAAGKLDTALFSSLHLTGLAYLQMGRGAEAKSAFQLLSEKSGQARALGLWGLGEWARRAGQSAAAKEYWMRALSLQPVPVWYSDLAGLCLRLKQADEAELFARRALEMETDFPDAVAALSEILAGQSRSKEAREILTDALKKNSASCELLAAWKRLTSGSGEIKAPGASPDVSCPDLF